MSANVKNHDQRIKEWRAKVVAEKANQKPQAKMADDGACVHVSEETEHGAFCKLCGETLA